MKIQPLKNLIGLMCFTMLAFAYILKICETPYKSPTMDFSYYLNALWCVIITTTTSFFILSFFFLSFYCKFKDGYGDMYAQTPLGRLFSVMIAFFGIFMVSITVVSITNTLDLNKTEMKSMNLLLRLEERKALRANASKLVATVASYRLQKKKNGYNPLVSKAYKVKIKQCKNDFSENIRFFF